LYPAADLQSAPARYREPLTPPAIGSQLKAPPLHQLPHNLARSKIEIGKNKTHVIKLLQWIIRLAGIAALILGAAYWFGTSFAPIDVHMTLGGLVALSLAILGIWASFARIRLPAALAAIIWAAAIVYVGTLEGLRTGNRFVQIVHPILGIGAIGLGEMLAAAISRRKQIPTS